MSLGEDAFSAVLCSCTLYPMRSHCAAYQLQTCTPVLLLLVLASQSPRRYSTIQCSKLEKAGKGEEFDAVVLLPSVSFLRARERLQPVRAADSAAARSRSLSSPCQISAGSQSVIIPALILTILFTTAS